jgi:hypothetical protein
MEGLFYLRQVVISLSMYKIYPYRFQIICSNISHNNISTRPMFRKSPSSILYGYAPHNKKRVRSIHTSTKGRLIWVYDITKLSINDGIVIGAPFRTKTMCAQVLNITRGTITLYLDSNKVLYNKWIFSSIELSKELLSKYLPPSTV